VSLDKPGGAGDQEPDKPGAVPSSASPSGTETKSPPPAETRSEAEHARDVMSRPPVRRYEDGASDPPRPVNPARTEQEQAGPGDGARAAGPAQAEPRSEAEHARDVMSRPPVRRPWLETSDVRPREADVPALSQPDRGDRGRGGETGEWARPDAGSVADGQVRVRVAEPAERVRPDSEERPSIPDEADGSSDERPGSAEGGRGGRDSKDSRPEDDEEATSPDRAVEREETAEQDEIAESPRERPQPPEVVPEALPDTGQDQAEDQRWAAMEQRFQAMEQQHRAELAELRADYETKYETLKGQSEELKAQVEEHAEREPAGAERRPSADDSPDSGERPAHTGPPDVVSKREHDDLQIGGDAADEAPREFEEPFRDALDHAAKHRINELNDLLDSPPEQQIDVAVNMCGFVAAFTAIDVVQRKWPTDAGLRRMAQKVAQAKVDEPYGVTEQNVYLFLSRCALGFEPYGNVFGDVIQDPGTLRAAPFFFATDMLATFVPEGQTIWQFLDLIEDAYEKAWLLDLNLLPALMVRARMPQPEQASGPESAGR
jgi:hypothetical protein